MAHASPKRHGDLKYALVDEDVFVETPHLDKGLRLDAASGFLEASAHIALPPSLAEIRPKRLFRFGRMFRRPNLPEFRPHPNDLIDLGRAMTEDVDPGVNPNLPAGYTFLGQFIDHDLTFDATETISYGALQAEDAESKRSPTLDLDSLYGQPPLADVMKTDVGRRVYQANKVNLAVGSTIRDGSVVGSFPNDLPRGLDPCQPKALAMIIDPRNDENLALAQIHLAFIKFHNAIVKHLSGTVRPEELLDKARELVVQHYQLIILNDYLPRIIRDDVLNDVMDNGCRHFVCEQSDEHFMPVEFAVAAFRLGHPMVRETYEWNRHFQGSQPADLSELFRFTGSHGHNFHNFGKLPSSWVIDWKRFFDFSHLDVESKHPLNYARTICPSIVRPLAELHSPIEDHRSLAVRNLLRGRLIGLPTGQSVALRLGITPLQPDEIADVSNRERHRERYEILTSCGFDQLTPLWYYILRESEFFHEGERLGPVGSRIVAETFVQLIKLSKISILPRSTNGRPSWRSDLTASGKFVMADLLFFVSKTLEDEKDFLNPLGD